MTYNIGDIIWFRDYYFTDTGEHKAHFGLTLLPDGITFKSNIYCSVVTSGLPKNNFFHNLDLTQYKCFSKPTYACLDRQDYQSMSDIEQNSKQPKGTLCKNDFEKCFIKLKYAMYATFLPYNNDPYFRGVVIREWKKRRLTI